uniref:Uncharacterized protein n=1 Tax=Glossina pallidipes TaxID=7398 RepID=A0A1A9Z8D2_GLOPL
MVKNGNQQNMKRPTIIAKVLAALVSIRNRLTCALMLPKVAQHIIRVTLRHIDKINIPSSLSRECTIRPLQKPPRRPTSVRSSDFLITRLFCGSEAVRCSGSSKLLLISQLKSGPSASPSPSPSPSSEQPEIVL